MPRVHYVKAARKENPVAKVGESYYWWKFRFGGKHFSKTPPKPSQLTQSAFLGEYYEIQESIADISANTIEELEEAVRDLCSRIEELRDMAQDSLDNMPEQLQEGDTGQMLQERVDMCDQWSQEMESTVSGIDEPDKDADDYEEQLEQVIADAISDLEGTDPGMS